jgi:hypothetical protein
MTDIRALCAELVDELDAETGYTRNDGTRITHPTVAEARAALSQPEPQASKPAPDYGRVPEIATEAQIRSAAQYLVKKQGCDGDLVPAIRYAIARWGRPAIEPIPVSERLPGPEDCAPEGSNEVDCCWLWNHYEGFGQWELQYKDWAADGDYTHWLPHHALPVPRP